MPQRLLVVAKAELESGQGPVHLLDSQPVAMVGHNPRQPVGEPPDACLVTAGGEHLKLRPGQAVEVGVVAHGLGEGPRLRDRGLGGGEAALGQLAEGLEPQTHHHGRERAAVARPRHPPVGQVAPGGVVVEFGGRQPEGQEALRGVTGHRLAARHRDDGLAQRPGSRRQASLGHGGKAIEHQVARGGRRLRGPGHGPERPRDLAGHGGPAAPKLRRERLKQDVTRQPSVAGPDRPRRLKQSRGGRGRFPRREQDRALKPPGPRAHDRVRQTGRHPVEQGSRRRRSRRPPASPPPPPPAGRALAHRSGGQLR